MPAPSATPPAPQVWQLAAQQFSFDDELAVLTQATGNVANVIATRCAGPDAEWEFYVPVEDYEAFQLLGSDVECADGTVLGGLLVQISAGEVLYLAAVAASADAGGVYLDAKLLCSAQQGVLRRVTLPPYTTWPEQLSFDCNGSVQYVVKRQEWEKHNARMTVTKSGGGAV